jgi:hypothetical protein
MLNIHWFLVYIILSIVFISGFILGAMFNRKDKKQDKIIPYLIGLEETAKKLAKEISNFCFYRNSVNGEISFDIKKATDIILSAVILHTQVIVKKFIDDSADRLCNECEDFVPLAGDEPMEKCHRDPKECDLLAAILKGQKCE